MSFLSKLFGGKPKEVEPDLYGDYRIYPEPQKEGTQYRVAGRVEKDFDGETKTHDFVRADMAGSVESAVEATIRKARLLVDQQGDRIFK